VLYSYNTSTSEFKLAKVALVYFSNTDVTKQLVEAAISELEQIGIEYLVHQINGKEIVEGRYKNNELISSLPNSTPKCDTHQIKRLIV
jgi:flavorubredoxin